MKEFTRSHSRHDMSCNSVIVLVKCRCTLYNEFISCIIRSGDETVDAYSVSGLISHIIMWFTGFIFVLFCSRMKQAWNLGHKPTNFTHWMVADQPYYVSIRVTESLTKTHSYNELQHIGLFSHYTASNSNNSHKSPQAKTPNWLMLYQH